MIERIVLIKLNSDDATAANRTALLAHTRSTLSDLPGLRTLALGLPSDPDSLRSWDVSVVMAFDDKPSVDRAVDEPRYQSWLSGAFGAQVAVVKSWSFERWEPA